MSSSKPLLRFLVVLLSFCIFGPPLCCAAIEFPNSAASIIGSFCYLLYRKYLRFARDRAAAAAKAIIADSALNINANSNNFGRNQLYSAEEIQQAQKAQLRAQKAHKYARYSPKHHYQQPYASNACDYDTVSFTQEPYDETSLSLSDFEAAARRGEPMYPNDPVKGLKAVIRFAQIYEARRRCDPQNQAPERPIWQSAAEIRRMNAWNRECLSMEYIASLPPYRGPIGLTGEQQERLDYEMWQDRLWPSFQRVVYFLIPVFVSGVFCSIISFFDKWSLLWSAKALILVCAFLLGSSCWLIFDKSYWSWTVFASLACAFQDFNHGCLWGLLLIGYDATEVVLEARMKDGGYVDDLRALSCTPIKSRKVV